MKRCLAFKRLDNYASLLAPHTKSSSLVSSYACKSKKKASEKISFISLSARHFRSSRAAQKRDRHKNSYKLFKLNKKATKLFFLLFIITLEPGPRVSNMRGLFIVVYGEHKRLRRDPMYLHRNEAKKKTKEKKKN
jgi:hypothetical protein